MPSVAPPFARWRFGRRRRRLSAAAPPPEEPAHAQILRAPFVALLAAALGLASPAAACDGPDAPCPVAGPWGEGEYRLALPEGPVGPAVVFLHGWGGRADAIIADAGLVEGLRGRGYAVIAPQGMPRRPGDQGGA